MDAQAIEPSVDERKEGTMRPMTKKLTRWSGLAAMIAGTIFIAIQIVHPTDVLASVTTDTWKIVISLKLVMCFLFLAGITGLYVRQADRLGRFGLFGFLLLGLSWLLQVGFVFTELFVLPVLATTAPQFVESVLGMASGSPGSMNIGALPVVYGVVFALYLLGGLVLGTKMFRVRVLSRWPAGLMVVAAAVTPFAALLPHALQRYAAVPMGVALIWLGYMLYREHRQEQAS